MVVAKFVAVLHIWQKIVLIKPAKLLKGPLVELKLVRIFVYYSIDLFFETSTLPLHLEKKKCYLQAATFVCYHFTYHTIIIPFYML